MQIDWLAIGSGAVSSIVFVGLLRILLDRSFAHVIRKEEERYRAIVEAEYRLKAKITDERFLAYQHLSRLGALVKEKTAVMQEYGKKGWSRDFFGNAHQIGRLSSEYGQTLQKHNLVLPNEVRESAAHLLALAEYFGNQWVPQEEQLPEFSDFHESYLEELKQKAAEIRMEEARLDEIMRDGIGSA